MLINDELEQAIAIITRVAAECVRLDGVPFEDDAPVGKRKLLQLGRLIHARGRDLATAITLIRTYRHNRDRKTTP